MDDPRRFDGTRQRLLVTGVDSVVGANLALSLADRFDVLGLFGSRSMELAGCRTLACDLSDPTALTAVVRQTQPRWILHAGPLSRGSWDIPQDQADVGVELRVVRRLAKLAETARGIGCRLTVVSTDAVFSGPGMFRREQSPTSAASAHARAAGAVELALAGSEALLVRTHAYGWSPPGTQGGFAERTWRALSEGSRCSFRANSHATPIHAAHLAERLLGAYRRGLSGLYHVAGAERVSQYRFACELAVAFELRTNPTASDEDFRDGSRGDGPIDVQETSLDTRPIRRELRCAMPMLREGLDRLAEEAANGFRERLKRPGASLRRTAA